MEIGMLWFDNSSSNLNDKVVKAADYYQDKYGQSPTHCVVNPETLNKDELKIGKIEVRPSSTIRPNHLWIGVDENGHSNGNRKN
jgi:hypothetical protein